MTVHAMYIFDRHAECIFQKRWTNSAVPLTTAARASDAPEQSSSIAPINGVTEPLHHTQVNKDANDAKLVFGVVYSLRNMVRRLGGDDDEFISYRTGEYKLHYYETPTSMKFVMLTDLKTSSLRVVLHQIWANLYVEYVVRNPLSPVEHPRGVGVNNELFEMGLDRFIDLDTSNADMILV